MQARLAGLALFLAAILAGCATPGMLHVYSIAPASAESVRDAAVTGAAAELPSFLAPGDQLTGFAYDPFTDHFFLRLAPGDRMRVVDRPARAVKREFAIAGAPATGGGDLAVKPRDGHLFLLHPTEPAVIETTRLGRPVRTFLLARTTTPGAGLAYDAEHDTLLVLHRDDPVVAVHRLDGSWLRTITLARAVGPALGFDAEKRELYAPLAGADRALGVFDEAGRLLRSIASDATYVDVGPRSFIRVF